LGLIAADMDASGHRVHRANRKIETLPDGLTKNPVPIVINRGDPSEVTLYEGLAFTYSKGYDLLIGTWAAYPCGLSADRWAEWAVYRADWLGKSQVIGHLPMKLHQERQSGWTRVSTKKKRAAGPDRGCFGMLSYSLKGNAGLGWAGSPLAPMANSAEKMVVRAQDVVAVRRAHKSLWAGWPRGPRVESDRYSTGSCRGSGSGDWGGAAKGGKATVGPLAAAGGALAPRSTPGTPVAARQASTDSGTVCRGGDGELGSCQARIPRWGDSCLYGPGCCQGGACSRAD
jgi:hypothetical protein